MFRNICFLHHFLSLLNALELDVFFFIFQSSRNTSGFHNSKKTRFWLSDVKFWCSNPIMAVKFLQFWHVSSTITGMAYLYQTYLSPTFGSSGIMMSQTRYSARMEREMMFLSKVFSHVCGRKAERQAGQEDFWVN